MYLSWIFDNTLYGISSTTLVVTIATLVLAVAYYSFKNSGLPPGPIGIPFFGYWPFIDNKECHLQFDAFTKKYGDVFSFTSTGTLYISLGSSKAVREAHITKSECFSKRTETFNYMNAIFAGGIIAQNGEEWKILRKFFLQILKDRVSLSVKNLLSGSLHDSANSTIDQLRDLKGETVDIIELLADKCNANLRLTLFGETGISEERVREVNELYVATMAFFISPNLFPIGNFARYFIFPFTPGYKESKVNLRRIKKILYEIIDEHKSTYDEDHIRDIIDDYIRERNVRRSKGDPSAQYFTDKALMSSLIQIVGDGVFSVAAFTGLLLHTLLVHPEEQEKIYKELVEVVGVERQPTIEDKSRLSYTNAFMQEALRSTDIVPLFPSFECTQETTLRGYRIPKGSILVLNTYSVHNDPEVYSEPRKFDPTRFMVTEGKRKAEPIVTFGVGKRACIGENFTMIQIFLFLTTLIKNFHISPPKNVNYSTEFFVEGKLRIVLQPRK